jgi:hypothetical protein
MNEKNEYGESHFTTLNKKVFIENIDSISQMIDDLLPSLKIKEVRPPLVLN